MPGGLFAISREYFEHIGTYDPGMDQWGGENLELSFKTWMCGGVVEEVLCSCVGHIFRPPPYKIDHNRFVRNTNRLAKVWMDEYAAYYYEVIGNDTVGCGDVTSRVELRKQLNCKPFDWYMRNVYPELFNPKDAVARGHIRSGALSLQSTKRDVCIDATNKYAKNNVTVIAYRCLDSEPQMWMLSARGEMIVTTRCLDNVAGRLTMYACHGKLGNQYWIYGQDNTLKQPAANMCIELSADGTKISMQRCTGSDRQIWYWNRK